MSIKDSIKRLREALAAGPTPGPWVATGNGVHRGARCVLTTDMQPKEQRDTDAAYIAACSPEVLAHLLAALDEREALREDAERYRWLRNEAWAGYNQGRGLPHVFTVDGAGNRRTMLAEAALDAATDAARKEPT